MSRRICIPTRFYPCQYGSFLLMFTSFMLILSCIPVMDQIMNDIIGGGVVVVTAFSVMCPISKHGSSSSSLGDLLERKMSFVGEASGIHYDEPVFRPPAEWRSLLLQVTIGCSWNKCTFCEMYQTKEFRAKSLQDIENELQQIQDKGGSLHVRDVFLADGDAMTLPTLYLVQILDLIQQYLPHVRRISSYCLPRNIRYTSIEDLALLQSKGLTLVYIGCESGNDTVLEAVQKGETKQSSLDALHKLQQAGIKRSVMILLGLGGIQYSTQHAIDSAMLCSEASPEYLSVLTTSFPRGMDRVKQGFENINMSNNNNNKTTSLLDGNSSTFVPLTARQGLEELELFLKNVHITTNRTIFRSDHASNYLVLKGRLGRDKESLLQQLRTVLDAPPEDDIYNLRPEWSRGL